MKIEKEYIKLINNSIYDYTNQFIGEENRSFFQKPLKEFCKRQVEKFDSPDQDKHGCCLNFSLYLLSKFNGIFMTCKDQPTYVGGKPTIHCSFVYEENGELFVADPAVDKTKGTITDYCHIPLSSYNFPMENQQYTMYLGITRDSESSFLAELSKGERKIFKSFESITDEDINDIKNYILSQIQPGSSSAEIKR